MIKCTFYLSIKQAYKNVFVLGTHVKNEHLWILVRWYYHLWLHNAYTNVDKYSLIVTVYLSWKNFWILERVLVSTFSFTTLWIQESRIIPRRTLIHTVKTLNEQKHKMINSHNFPPCISCIVTIWIMCRSHSPLCHFYCPVNCYH